MRKFLIRATAVVVGIVFFCLVTMEAEWRYPSGQSGDVQVRYTIPVSVDGKEGANEFRFWIAGHVERVQFIPISGHNEHGFVMFYVKTTEGWYETPTASLGGPIDWSRGVKVEFIYPEGMALRGQTRDAIRGFHSLSTGIRWHRDSFGFVCSLTEGEISSVRFSQESGVDVVVRRTSGLFHHGYAGGEWGRVSVEVSVSDK